MLFGLNKREAKKEEASLPCVGPFCDGGAEPSLQEMLSDPLVQQLARSDKIRPDELSENVKLMREKLRQKKTAH